MNASHSRIGSDRRVLSSRTRLAGSAAAAAILLGLPIAPAEAAPLPQSNTLVSVCSGVSLPASVVTDIMGPVVNDVYSPIESTVNGLLTLVDPLIILPLPSPLSVDLATSLDDAANGGDINLSVLASDGTLVGPAGQCDAAASSYTLDAPAGIAIGGNQVTGLGDAGEQANAGEIDSIAIGNRASTDSSAVGSIAFGPDASVGASATHSVAIGTRATASAANSVALGADSVADRADTVSIGASGAERQLTNVAAGTQATDAVNLGQLNAVQNQVDTLQVQVDGNTSAITNLQASVGGNTTAITNLQTGVNNNSTAITNLANAVTNGAVGPVQYSDAGTPTVPNSGTPSNDVTLVGAAPGAVGLHNVADGYIGAGSTDAVNGGQLFDAVFGAVADVVTYDDASHSSVTLNNGGGATVVHNVAPGTAGTDAVNVNQLNGMMSTMQASTVNMMTLNFDLMDRKMRQDRRDARAGTSAALAAAGMPQAVGAGRTMIAGGVGAYRGRVGVAVGASHRSDDGKKTFKLGVTYDASEHVGANAGFGIEL